MNSLFHENKQSFLLLLALLFILLTVVYFFFYLPMNQELKSKENNMELVEKDVSTLQSEVMKLEEGNQAGVEPYMQAEKLPQDPELEKLILTLQEIEFISDSRIDNINFTYGGSKPLRTDVEDEVEAEPEPENQDEELEEVEQVESVIDLVNKPDNLEVISVSMAVNSPDYEHFQLFLNQIEKQERFMTVSSLHFQKPAERELLLEGDSFQTITANVTITTFYYQD
ncbi:hypothetical protein KGF86_17705 [Ornithinibacillus massiliensis]|uniref:Potassium transporter n=1 Tax=Ornithinibacillus massiliensis TaxID=1944633 RepID=A0ABS5MI60_9BACI|nr:hypothetical protein [Ornithinibacillus massiliensis]MBS3682031.1 hypothetical protein [Ornithinibacillus massiliensis]